MDMDFRSALLRRPFCVAILLYLLPANFSSVKSAFGLDFLFAGLSPLYKPSTDVVSGKVRTAFKNQMALVTADSYRIAVALASSFQCGSLTDIGHTVYLIFLSVLSSDDPWEHRAVSGKISFDGYIC